VTTAEQRTGFVVIQLVDGQHRSLVFSPGANTLLSWSVVVPALDALATCDIVITQSEVPADTVDRLIAWAEDEEIPVYLDPASPQQASRRSLLGAEIITPDKLEAEALTGRTMHGVAAPILAAHDLASIGIRRAVLKLGPAGALFVDDGVTTSIPTHAVEAVDETGAGDVFVATLAVERASGVGWIDAIRFANAAAAVSVSRNGLAMPSIADIEAVVEMIGPATVL
jgi:ribokinase